MQYLKIEFFNRYVQNLESKTRKYRRLFATKERVSMNHFEINISIFF